MKTKLFPVFDLRTGSWKEQIFVRNITNFNQIITYWVARENGVNSRVMTMPIDAKQMKIIDNKQIKRDCKEITEDCVSIYCKSDDPNGVVFVLSKQINDNGCTILYNPIEADISSR